MMKRHKKGEQLHRNLISAQARFSRVHERQKKGAQMQRNLMGGLARLCLRGIRKNHKKREQLHRNLVDGQARFSLREGDNIAAEDFISELPEEILCYIASFLPLREAARTSILARKWRYLWRSLLNLNFDVTNMTGNEYELREMVTCSDLIFRYYGDREANLLQKKELSFVMWVNQVLELHDSGKIKSCKIDFPLDGQYSDNLDSCIQNLATKGVEELHIKLSGHDMYRRCYYKLCKFPYWHFARVEGSSSLKHLALDYCAFNPKNNFSCLSNLISLSLKHIDLSQDDVDNIFECTRLESFKATICYFGKVQLKIASKRGNLKLKHLNISFCPSLEKLEICGATNILSLEFRGPFLLQRISFTNCAIPVKLSFDSTKLKGITYASGQLATDFPRLHTLSLSLTLRHKEGWMIPEQFQTFSELKDLVLRVGEVDPEFVLKLTIAFLKASPVLRRLELHLPRVAEETASELPRRLPFQKLFKSNCLKEVKMFNFQGAPIQLQLGTYFLRNATGLENMTVAEGNCMKVMVNGPRIADLCLK